MKTRKMTAGLKLKTAMLTAALALLTAGTARADANPANDSGEFTVRITPNVDLGVVVDTTGANWAGSANLDVTSDLNAENLLENPVTVSMAGNFANQELTLTGAALNTWQLDTDELDAVDEMRLYSLLGKYDFSLAPVEADFDGTVNLITSGTNRVGQPEDDELADDNHAYEFPVGHAEYGGGDGEMDGMGPTATRRLWLRARTPSSSTADGQAAFTVTVTAVTGVGL